MASWQVFRGLTLDDAMEPGFIRIMGTTYKTWVLNPATYQRVSDVDGFAYLASMAEVAGPGIHPLPADWL